MIVCRSPTSIESYPPGGPFTRDWMSSPVGRGKFTVASDAEKLAPHLEHLISARKAQALAENDLLTFRLLHSCKATLLDGTGIQLVKESYSQWMAAMRFDSVHDGKRTGLTPLVFAVFANRADFVATLLERGADLHQTLKINRPEFNLRKRTPLFAHAAIFGDAEIVKLLLEHGADPRREPMPSTARKDHMLAPAIFGENDAAVKTLLAHDPELLDLRNAEKQLPLELAAGFGKLEMLRSIEASHPGALAKLGRQKANYWGNSRVAFAILSNAGNVDVIKLLLDAGEPVDLVGDVAGNVAKMIHAIDFMTRFKSLKSVTGFWSLTFATRITAAGMAAFYGNIGALKLCMDRGADLESYGRNPRKLTPLHLAVLGGHLDAVSVLLDGGARTDVRNRAGRTPADLAKRLGLEAIQQRLQEATHQQQDHAPPAKPTQSV